MMIIDRAVTILKKLKKNTVGQSAQPTACVIYSYKSTNIKSKSRKYRKINIWLTTLARNMEHNKYKAFGWILGSEVSEYSNMVTVSECFLAIFYTYYMAHNK